MNIQANYIKRANQFGDNYRVSYNSWGHPESEKGLLCVYGLNRNSRDFDFVAERMIKQGYYVVAPDLPGRGNSDHLNDYRGYSLESNIADLLGLMTQLQLGKVDFLGVSLGGVLGMLLAGLPHKPVNKLILSDIGAEIELSGVSRIASYSSEQPDFETFEEACEYLRSFSSADGIFDNEVWQHMFINSFQRNPFGRWELKRDVKLAKSLAEGMGAGGNIEFWVQWKEILNPTLLIHGELSDLLLVSTINKMQQLNTNTEVLSIPDSGHSPYLYREPHLAKIEQFLLE